MDCWFAVATAVVATAPAPPSFFPPGAMDCGALLKLLLFYMLVFDCRAAATAFAAVTGPSLLMSLASVPGLVYLTRIIPTAACFAIASLVLMMTTATATAAAADVAWVGKCSNRSQK